MKKSLLKLTLAAATLMALATTASAAVVQSFDFSGAITTGPVQAPGVWYTDRYAPAGFATSGGQLVQTISSADSISNRPAAYNSAFYDTQGRKLDLNPGVKGVSIDLYVPLAWASAGQRIAGIWGTAFDNTNALTSYPILEFASDGTGARFQGWNDALGWVNYGLPGGASFAYDAMHTLAFVLDGAYWDYMLDGNVLGQVSALGSTSIGNVILQGINKFTPSSDTRSYNILWDNLVATDGTVPEPASLALVSLALVAIGTSRHKAKKTIASPAMIAT